MASNVIGIFDNESIGDQVVEDLVSGGFDRSDIYLYRGDSQDLATQLQTINVAADEAQQYASEIDNEGALVVVQADDTRTDEAVAIMQRYYTSSDSDDTAQYATGTTQSEGATTFEVAEERLQVGKREVQRGGVRVRSVVSETPVEQQVSLRDETIRVERKAVDRPADASDTNVFNDQSVEFTETDEEAVVAKEARVIEEVTVGKDVEQRTDTIRDTVRRVDVDIEEVSAQYGESLASDERYAGREWDEVEPEARTRWESENQDKGSWDEAQGGIRGAWDRLRGKG